MHLILLVIVGLAMWAWPGPPGSEVLGGTTQSLDEWIIAEMETHQIPGLAVAVVDAGRIVKAQGYGLANVELEAPTSENTVFQTASVGKQFTAAAILLLVEDGELGLDDPITDYLDDLPDSWRLITIRNLLNHTSGIPDYGAPPWDLRRDFTEKELLREFAGFTLHFPPGEEWSYTNAGYAILGALMGEVTGAHWGEFVRERILEPAGMTSARVISEEDLVPNRASGYRLLDGQLKNQEWVSPSVNSTADGALSVSALDMAHWAVSITDSSILSDALRELMWTPTELTGGDVVAYGFGWSLQEVAGRPAVGHAGAWQGFVSDITMFTEDSLTVILMANRAGFGLGAIREEIAARYRPEIDAARRIAPQPVVISEEEREDYTGYYWMPDGNILEFRMEGEGISLTGAGISNMLLLPYEADSFFIEESPSARFLFPRNPDTGAVKGFQDGSGMFRGRKVR